MEPLASLIDRARRGDVDAYEQAVRRTQHLVHGIGLRILRQPALAQDAAQETYLRAFRRLGELDEPGAFPGWLRRIAVTVAINLRRSRRRTLVSLDDVDEVLAWGVYSDAIVRHLGGDPGRHTAFGAGYGLERVAALRYDIDDIRRMETARIA